MARMTVAQIMAAAAGVAACLAAYFRGDYLLGPGCGALYVGVSLGLLWLLARSRSKLQAACMAVLTLACAFAMVWPASINPWVQVGIDEHAVERAARTELGAVLASDPAYRHLSVSSVKLKVVNISVRGTLSTRADFGRLQARLPRECPALGKCVLEWDVAFRDSSPRVAGFDRDLFRAPE